MSNFKIFLTKHRYFISATAFYILFLLFTCSFVCLFTKIVFSFFLFCFFSFLYLVIYLLIHSQMKNGRQKTAYMYKLIPNLLKVVDCNTSSYTLPLGTSCYKNRESLVEWRHKNGRIKCKTKKKKPTLDPINAAIDLFLHQLSVM